MLLPMSFGPAIARAQTGPVITQQPTNQIALIGSSVNFGVAVSGAGPFTYQWEFNGAKLTNNISLANSIITTVAGNGTSGYSADGGYATNAQLDYPVSVSADVFGNIFIAEYFNNCIREVGTNGRITTVAGNGTGGFSGDGGYATNANLNHPTSVAVDVFGNIFIADYGNERIREVGTNGLITTVAGNGTVGYSGDGGYATNAQFGDPLFYESGPYGVCLDAVGNIFIADSVNGCIRKVGTNGIITTVAGNGWEGFSGDGGYATNAELYNPLSMTVDTSGNLFIADLYNHRIREVGTDGIITTMAGNGTAAYFGDGGQATNASLDQPGGVAVDAYGNVFIADCDNNRIRRVDNNGIITTLAGTGTGGYSGDGGTPTNAELNQPQSVALDGLGNLIIADSTDNRIRKVSDLYQANQPSLTFTDVAFANDGSYDVVVSNAYGSVTSSVATLFVVAPAAITAQPQSQTVLAGTNVTFCVTAGGIPQVYYQWYWASNLLPDQTNSTLSLVGVSLTNAGNYQLVVTNLYGSATSSVAALTVLAAAITAQPQSGHVSIGSNATFSVAATATASLGYQWYFDAAVLSGQTNSTLSLVGVNQTNAGNYQVVMTNIYGSVTSSMAILLVGYPLIITAQPTNEIGVIGGAVNLNVSVSGTGPFTYQWQFNGTNLPNGIITTVAGGGRGGDGGAATNAGLELPDGVAVDAWGNVFIADTGDFRIREVGTDGIITTVAGGGNGGDGSAATNANVGHVYGMAVDANGNLFITAGDYIREVGTNGIIITVAGGGKGGVSLGDGGAATNAYLAPTYGVVVDANGNLFIAAGNRIREVGTNGIITTVAGGGHGVGLGDGGAATNANVAMIYGVAVDVFGNIFITDTENSRIRKVDASGIITTVAGGGYGGDGGPATNGYLHYPRGVTVDGLGNLFIADTGNSRIREVNANGIITTVAGRGTEIFGGDGGLAINASLDEPSGMAVDASGNLFIADSGHSRIRKVVFQGPSLALTNVAASNAGSYDVVVTGPFGSVTSSVATITTVFPAGITAQPQPQVALLGSNATFNVIAGGTGTLFYQWYFGGVLLPDQTNTTLVLSNVSSNSAGYYQVVITNLYASVTSIMAALSVVAPTLQPQSQEVMAGSTAKLSLTVFGSGPWTYQWQCNGTNLPNNIIITVAGGGTGSLGDGGPATNASTDYTSGAAVDRCGEFFFADSGSERIRKVGTNGIITTVAGNGVGGYSGDGGAATNANLDSPAGLAVDAYGNLFIVTDNFIRKVNTNGIITTVAGGGVGGETLLYPSGVAVDAYGNLFIADSGNNRIVEVEANGIATTVAGNGKSGPGSYSGDGGAAANAELNYPSGVAEDAYGNLFIADFDNSRIRKVDTHGIITTVAGNGAFAYSGDGGQATNASLYQPWDVAVDAYGNLFIADTGNFRIREVEVGGIITTVAGNGAFGYSGDGGAATNANLDYSSGVAVDAYGNLFIAVNNRIREVVVQGPNLVLTNVAASDAGSYDVVVTGPCGSVTSSVVALTVLLPPQNLSASLSPGQGVQFQFTGTPGRAYVLLATTNLAPPIYWQPVVTNFADTNGNWTFTDTNIGANPARFYRAMLP
jgi:sugar lactone lactonase YvrE